MSESVLIAYSVPLVAIVPSSATSFPIQQWIDEVRQICGQHIPVILVGCKSDLRPPPNSPNSSDFVSSSKAAEIAREIGARSYKECSALRAEGVDDVFEEATRASMLMREGVSSSSNQRRRESGKVDGYDGYGEKSAWKCCVVT